MNELRNDSKGIEEHLARIWPTFVNCHKRLITEAPFLQKLINLFPNPIVLDAAMGIGCEVVWLAKNGIDVIGNEINPILSQIAYNRARKSGVTIRVENVDWRKLDIFWGPNRFDIILLIGNSFCLLKKKYEQLRVAKILRKICKKNAILIIDERNFRYIIEDYKEILDGKFRYSRKVIYCGKNITGRPISISSDCITFGYFDTCLSKLVGKLDMYPFKEGELIEIFLQAGFKNFKVFSDYSKGFNPNADFYTYVFYS